jgi:signal peptidase II
VTESESVGGSHTEAVARPGDAASSAIRTPVAERHPPAERPVAIAAPEQPRLLRGRPAARRELVFLVGAAVVLIADQLTKLLVMAALHSREPIRITGWLHLTYLENRGAAFGVLQNQTLFFIAVGIVVVVGLIASYRYLPAVPPLLNLGLGLQLGGALGNLVDRVRQGYVVDFVDLSWWPVFNLADAAILVGVAILAYYWIWAPAGAARKGSFT